MTVDFEKHAEAILRLAGIPDNLPYSPTAWDEARTAILAACRALAEDAALAMREAAEAAYVIEANKWDNIPAKGACARQGAKAIRAIDPASVMGDK